VKEFYFASCITTIIVRCVALFIVR